MVKILNFLIKPASSMCNMQCKYCFYDDVAKNRSASNLGMMTAETAHTLILSAYGTVGKGGSIGFAFQGGEPTLAGLDFYRDFTAFAREHRPRGIHVAYSIQTNGLGLNEEWAVFLKENHFLTGVSIDGDKALHDENRVDPRGKGTYHLAAKGVSLLLRHGVEVNLLCVVTKQLSRRPQKVYQALKKLGAGFLQFIPCLDPLEAERGSAFFSLDPESYGEFLCGLFDLWYQDWEKGNYTSIRLFDDYIHLAMGMPAGTCATSGSCGSYFVVEGDGSLYPCDFYVLDQWKLGMIGKTDLKDAADCGKAREFLREGLERPEECSSCRWLSLCNGGCKRDWQQKDGRRKNYYCAAFQKFFDYAEERIGIVAQKELLVTIHG